MEFRVDLMIGIARIIEKIEKSNEFYAGESRN